MAEALFAAAYAAGVVEGGSLLWNAENEHGSDTPRQQVSLAVSSLLYGTAALPMSILGASPGPVILSSLPYRPVETDSVAHVETEAAPSLRTLKTLPKPKNRSMDKEGESAQPSMEETKESQDDKRSELIRRTREENRKMIATVKQKRQQHVQQKSKTARNGRPRGNVMNRCFATLDGRPLATPLAEGMRRMRFLLVGAGLVTVLVSRQTGKAQQEATRPKESPIPQEGKDAIALNDFVRKHQDGVAIRLMKDQWKGSGNNSIPFVLGSGSVTSDSGQPPLYWKLGRTLQEWKQIPVSEQWLMNPSSSSSPLLVVEADVSIPLSASRGDTSNAEAHLSLESARFMSRVIDMVTRENFRGSSCGPPSLVTILIGSDSMASSGDEAANEVYIDGRSAVVAKVLSFAEAIHKELAPVASIPGLLAQDTDQHVALKIRGSAEAAPDEAPGNEGTVVQLISYIDTVGEKIRQGGVWTVNATKSLLGSRDKLLRVFSDDKQVAKWLRLAMPGWSVVFHDVSSEKDVSAISQHGGVVVVCCRDDETTSNVACSMLSSDQDGAKETKVLALVQRQHSVTALNWVIEGFTMNPSQKALRISAESIDGIHQGLFEQAQQLLASGKTPAEVQELMNANRQKANENVY